MSTGNSVLPGNEQQGHPDAALSAFPNKQNGESFQVSEPFTYTLPTGGIAGSPVQAA